VLWHDGQGMCLFSKRLERGRFIWASPADGTVAVTPAQLGYLLKGAPTAAHVAAGGGRLSFVAPLKRDCESRHAGKKDRHKPFVL
jgi:transposase